MIKKMYAIAMVALGILASCSGEDPVEEMTEEQQQELKKDDEGKEKEVSDEENKLKLKSGDFVDANLYAILLEDTPDNTVLGVINTLKDGDYVYEVIEQSSENTIGVTSKGEVMVVNTSEALDYEKNNNPDVLPSIKKAISGKITIATATAIDTLNFEFYIQNRDENNFYSKLLGEEKPFRNTYVSSQTIFSPVFEDMDGDGKKDLVLGKAQNGNGRLELYKAVDKDYIILQTQKTVSSTDYVLVSAQENPFATINSLSQSVAPAFIDWDNDGDKDLFIGQQDGTIKYYEKVEVGYRNDINKNPFTYTVQAAREGRALELVSPIVTRVRIKFGTGYATPAFYDVDNDGDLDLFCGSAEGVIYFYENNANGTFTNKTNNSPLSGSVTTVKGYSSPAFSDMNGDGIIDFVTGNGNGEIHWAPNKGNGTFGSIRRFAFIDLSSWSRPAFTDVNQDGKQDLVIGDFRGLIEYHKNVTTPRAEIGINVSIFKIINGSAADVFSSLER